MIEEKFQPIPQDKVKLLWSQYSQRAEANKNYLASMTDENLLRNFYLEAGLWGLIEKPKDDIHWGWESPTSQLRGHFLGHWMWAAARIYKSTGDQMFKARADYIVAELAKCQEANGGEWAGPIPEKYIEWTATTKYVWAPHYTIHKTLFGLFEVYKQCGNQQALEVLEKWANWFYKWSGQFTTEQMDNILDVETGGMMEVWADLYGATGKPEHLELMQRYERRRLFNRLLAGEDVLTNMHANTTIPEVMGICRAYEVTGDQRYRDIAEAYWKCAVTDRGYFATGGQTCGEVWTPPFEQAARLGDKNQEHCTVYHMIRLADYLYRWSGDVAYADYIERNTVNGIFAQQNIETGMVTYFLPFRPGSKKKWSTPTDDFWCCVATVVQAHVVHNSYVYFKNDDGFVVSQYIPTEASVEWNGVPVKIKQFIDMQKTSQFNAVVTPNNSKPGTVAYNLSVDAEKPVEFALQLRLPWWLAGEAQITVNDEIIKIDSTPSTFVSIKRTWDKDDKIHIYFPKKLYAYPLPDEPNTVAFMDGPVLLAGLTKKEKTLYGDKDNLETILRTDNEREWGSWKPGYKTRNQETNFRFVPLNEILDEEYTVYFPIKPAK